MTEQGEQRGKGQARQRGKNRGRARQPLSHLPGLRRIIPQEQGSGSSLVTSPCQGPGPLGTQALGPPPPVLPQQGLVEGKEAFLDNKES